MSVYGLPCDWSQTMQYVQYTKGNSIAKENQELFVNKPGTEHGTSGITV